MCAIKMCQRRGQTTDNKRAPGPTPFQVPMRNIDCALRDNQLSASRMKLKVRTRFSEDTDQNKDQAPWIKTSPICYTKKLN